MVIVASAAATIGGSLGAGDAAAGSDSCTTVNCFGGYTDSFEWYAWDHSSGGPLYGDPCDEWFPGLIWKNCSWGGGAPQYHNWSYGWAQNDGWNVGTVEVWAKWTNSSPYRYAYAIGGNGTLAYAGNLPSPLPWPLWGIVGWSQFPFCGCYEPVIGTFG
jgi:hypothetical protein